MDMSPPLLHHPLPVLDSGHSPLVLLRLYQPHIKILPIALLPVLFQRYTIATHSSTYANVYMLKD